MSPHILQPRVGNLNPTAIQNNNREHRFHTEGTLHGTTPFCIPISSVLTAHTWVLGVNGDKRALCTSYPC